MLTKLINIFLSVLLLLPIFAGALDFSNICDDASPRFQVCSQDHYPQANLQKPCDMDHCNPLMPNCALCPTANSVNPYLMQGAEAYLPPLDSSFVSINVNPLFDQGVVKSIFHPPPTIL